MKTTGRVFVACVVVAIACSVLLKSYRRASDEAQKTNCAAKLKAIGHAIETYASYNGTLPPLYLTDEDGARTISWRTIVSPTCFYDMEVDYFAKLDLNKRWDEEPNRSVLKRYVGTIQCPSNRRAGSGITQFVAIDGSIGLWQEPLTGKQFLSAKATTPMQESGATTSSPMDHKILVLEWPHSDVLWNEPRDLPVDEFLQWFESTSNSPKAPHSGVIQYLGSDYSVYELSLDSDLQKVRSLISK